VMTFTLAAKRRITVLNWSDVTSDISVIVFRRRYWHRKGLAEVDGQPARKPKPTDCGADLKRKNPNDTFRKKSREGDRVEPS
jgi:hypothetical protein